MRIILALIASGVVAQAQLPPLPQTTKVYSGTEVKRGAEVQLASVVVPPAPIVKRLEWQNTNLASEDARYMYEVFTVNLANGLSQLKAMVDTNYYDFAPTEASEFFTVRTVMNGGLQKSPELKK